MFRFVSPEPTPGLLASPLGHPGGSWYTANRDPALAQPKKRHCNTKKNWAVDKALYRDQ